MGRTDHFNAGSGNPPACSTCGLPNDDAVRRKVFGTHGCPTCGHNIPYEPVVSKTPTKPGGKYFDVTFKESQPYWTDTAKFAVVHQGDDGGHSAMGQGPKGDVYHDAGSKTEAVHGVMKKLAEHAGAEWEPLPPAARKRISKLRQDDD